MGLLEVTREFLRDVPSFLIEAVQGVRSRGSVNRASRFVTGTQPLQRRTRWISEKATLTLPAEILSGAAPRPGMSSGK